MSTFLELQTAVLDVTKRTDKLDEVKRQINSIIRMISLSGRWYPDIQELTLGALDGIDPATYTQSVSLPSNFRFPVYIKYPVAYSTCPIKLVDIETLLHPDYRSADNIAYVSGNSLRIRNRTLTDSFDMGAYFRPAALVNDADSNWITEQLDDVIIELTSSFIKTITGDENTGKTISQLAGAKLGAYLSDIVITHIPGVQ